MSENITVAYHSGYGHTEKVAKAVAEGISASKEVHVDIINVATITEPQWSILDASHAIVFGAPTYMGGVSGPFKNFLDATSSRWMKGAWKNKIAAGFTNSGSLSGDKLSSLQQMIVTAMQHSMVWVGQGEPSPTPKGTDVAGSDQINRMGSWCGLMTQSNNESPELAPPSGDLETARRFGMRIAEITKQFNG